MTAEDLTVVEEGLATATPSDILPSAGDTKLSIIDESCLYYPAAFGWATAATVTADQFKATLDRLIVWIPAIAGRVAPTPQAASTSADQGSTHGPVQSRFMVRANNAGIHYQVKTSRLTLPQWEADFAREVRVDNHSMSKPCPESGMLPMMDIPAIIQGDAPLAKTILVQFADNSGSFISFNVCHTLLDGPSVARMMYIFCILLNHPTEKPTQCANVSRDWLWRRVADTQPLTALVKPKPQTYEERLVNFNSKPAPTDLLSTLHAVWFWKRLVSKPLTKQMLRIPEEDIKALFKDVTSVPVNVEGEELSITVLDVAAAVLWLLTAHGRNQRRPSHIMYAVNAKMGEPGMSEDDVPFGNGVLSLKVLPEGLPDVPAFMAQLQQKSSAEPLSDGSGKGAGSGNSGGRALAVDVVRTAAALVRRSVLWVRKHEKSVLASYMAASAKNPPMGTPSRQAVQVRGMRDLFQAACIISNIAASGVDNMVAVNGSPGRCYVFGNKVQLPWIYYVIRHDRGIDVVMPLSVKAWHRIVKCPLLAVAFPNATWV